jgi:hypothetical protein
MLVFLVSSMLAKTPIRKGTRLSKFIPTKRACVAICNLRIRLASRRFDVAQVFSAYRLDKLAVDEVLNLLIGFHRLRAPAFATSFGVPGEHEHGRAHETSNVELRTSNIENQWR